MRINYLFILWLALALCSGCSGLHQISCTDFSDNPSFSYKKKSHHKPLKTKEEKNFFEKKEKDKKEDEKQEDIEKKREKTTKKEFSKPFKPKREYRKKAKSNGC